MEQHGDAQRQEHSVAIGDTEYETVPIIGWALGYVVYTLVALAGIVAVFARVWPDTEESTHSYGLLFTGVIREMIRRPIRNLKRAVAGGLVVGVATGTPVSQFLTGHLSGDWVVYFGYVVGWLVGILVFAGITHLPAKRVAAV